MAWIPVDPLSGLLHAGQSDLWGQEKNGSRSLIGIGGSLLTRNMGLTKGVLRCYDAKRVVMKPNLARWKHTDLRAHDT